MMYFLDTNICIYLLKGQFPKIKETLSKKVPENIKIPSIVKAELLYGAKKSHYPEKTILTAQVFLAPFEIIPFCEKASDYYAENRFELEKKGIPVGPNDLIIAATTLTHNGILVTYNVRAFKRIKSLKIENWTT